MVANSQSNSCLVLFFVYILVSAGVYTAYKGCWGGYVRILDAGQGLVPVWKCLRSSQSRRLQ